jgi:HlyD family secretion protein
VVFYKFKNNAMVDIIRKKKKWTTKRLLTIGGIAGILLLIGGSYYFTAGPSKLGVDTERITISEVKKGPFQENIPVNGVVLPIISIYLDATEGGRVEQKYVEDGTIMKKDEPIMRLSNTDVQLNLATQETGVFTLLTQMQLSRINAQQNTVSKLTQMADVESSFKEAERIYNLDKHLYEQKVIGSQELKKAENDYSYYSQKLRLTREILKQDTIAMAKQSEQDKQSYERAQEGLQIMRKKVGDLVVRSPIDGQLTSLNAEVGQLVHAGDRLGQIDVLTGFKVRVLNFDEHYVSRIFTGLTATWPFGDSTYKLKITKVYTALTNGTFQVDMNFVGAVPKGIRRGQTLQLVVALSEEKQAIQVPKGGFYQQTGGNWIFKVSEDGKRAYKVDIQLGNQTIDYYEVLQGLKPGDKVITSSYETYGNIQELILKK